VDSGNAGASFVHKATIQASLPISLSFAFVDASAVGEWTAAMLEHHKCGWGMD